MIRKKSTPTPQNNTYTTHIPTINTPNLISPYANHNYISKQEINTH